MSSLVAEDVDVEFFEAKYDYATESSSEEEYFDAEYDHTLRIPFEDISSATKHFAEENLLKRGGKADVYKGLLLRSGVGIHVVIRKYSGDLKFDFYKEIEKLSGLKHRNIVSLIGFCDEENERLIVMEHVVHGCLDQYLSEPTLTWCQRLNICFGAACALEFSHNTDKGRYFYKIKCGFKILLDTDWEAKVLANCIESETENLEVLSSLGMILLEVVYGRKATIEDVNLYHNKEMEDMIAPNLRAQMHPQSLRIFSKATNYCLNKRPDQHRADLFHKTLKRLKEAFVIQWKHENLLRVENFTCMKIPLSHIMWATNNFSYSHLIESYRCDKLYKAELYHFDRESLWTIDRENKGELSKKRVIIKRFNYKTTPKDFFTEIEMLSSFKHPNLVSLLGFCDEDSEMILVLECDFNETLNDYLRSASNRTNLTWEQQIRICLDIAHGLKYLHNIECKPGMLHHIILSTDVFLDEKWTAKVAGFRLSELNLYPTSLRQSYQSLVVDDIYFLGLILFEILNGSPVNYDTFYKELDVNEFASMIRRHYNEGKLKSMTYPLHTLSKSANQDSLHTFSEITYQCLVETPSKPPPLEVVIKSLEKALHFQVRENLRIPLEAIHFSRKYRIGSEKCGEMYQGELKRSSQYNIGTNKKVVVKRFSLDKCLDVNNFSWEHGFLKEFEVLFKYKHENIIGLVGYCEEMKEKNIVYEHVANKGTLRWYLKDSILSWTKRLEICIDIANGLKFLHEGGVGLDAVIHRDLKSSKILLTGDWKAKICGFEHAITYPANKEFEYVNVANDVVGSHGYCDPLYLETHTITKESDIYSFGVILFEILCGRFACQKNSRDGSQFLDVWVKNHFGVGQPDDIVLKGIKKEIVMQSLATFRKTAFQCLHEKREQRPTAGHMVVELQKALEIQKAKGIQEALHKNYKDIPRMPEKMRIPLEVIQMATYNFNKKYLIGSGGYGTVYKAELPIKMRSNCDLSIITVAIKRISSRGDCQGKEGFIAELDVLSRCEHPNIVSLLGYCVEGSEMILVYEYVSNGSLNDYLGSTEKMVNLTWTERLKMCIKIADGLNYLHTNMEGKRKIIHRDIKSGNILLGENREAKIGDFGFSILFPVDHQASTINTNIVAGTYVYLDPEYDRTGRFKRASDIYSFGVVLLEIFSGKLAYDSVYLKRKIRGLAPIAKRHFEMGTLIKEMLDPKIMDDEAYELGLTLKIRPDYGSLDAFSRIANQCVAKTQADRPTIEVVIKELKKALCLQENRLTTRRFSLQDIKMGVENFSDANCIMRGKYEILYKGEIQYDNSHKEVVVKRYNGFGQEDGFLKEFEVLFKYRQKNIIGLVGYCNEINEKIIVYEDASMGCLDRYLNDTGFTWIKRLKICVDIANGLKFLHGGDVGQEVVIHGDIKSSNILLTKDWKAKIHGFECALTYPTNKEMDYVISDVAGSPGYCDPLYWKTKILTKESDIYSFGVILFEILCGRSACPEDVKDHNPFIDDLVKRHFQLPRVDEIVFEGIKKQIVQKSFDTFQMIAFQCLHEEREERPTANAVVTQLKKAWEIQEAYEKRNDKLQSIYKEILDQFPTSPDTERRKDIYNILSKGILEDDKLITHVDV